MEIVLLLVLIFVVIGVTVWLSRLQSSMDKQHKEVITELQIKLLPLPTLDEMVGINHAVLTDIQDRLDPIFHEEPKCFNVRIVDIESGESKNYEYEDCEFIINDEEIKVVDSYQMTDFGGLTYDKLLGSHSLINRQYDITECN